MTSSRSSVACRFAVSDLRDNRITTNERTTITSDVRCVASGVEFVRQRADLALQLARDLIALRRATPRINDRTIERQPTTTTTTIDQNSVNYRRRTKNGGQQAGVALCLRGASDRLAFGRLRARRQRVLPCDGGERLVSQCVSSFSSSVRISPRGFPFPLRLLTASSSARSASASCARERASAARSSSLVACRSRSSCCDADIGQDAIRE